MQQTLMHPVLSILENASMLLIATSLLSLPTFFVRMQLIHRILLECCYSDVLFIVDALTFFTSLASSARSFFVFAFFDKCDCSR